MKHQQQELRASASGTRAAIIIGAGFGGIGMAIALRKAGITDFVILEKSNDVGGVWRDNSYPGAACDVPSHLYSFSFAPNPDWSRAFANQAEIHAYLKDCTQRFGVTGHLIFGAEVDAATFDEGADTWTVSLRDGRVFESRLLITATGQLSKPAQPDLPGLERFRGHTFHSAKWDHGYALDGKRVAVVGTGASAIQFVPAIAPRVASLALFQRSPAYIMPRPDRPYAGFEKAIFRRIPGVMALHRAFIYLKYESRAIAFTRIRSLMKIAVGRPFRKMLDRQVPDPALRARLVPDYPIGCKRILLSSEYLATMTRPNLTLVTDAIRSVTETGIETADGRRHEVDAIIFGTGFAATEFLSPMRIVGRDGVALNDAWQGGAQAYLGMSVPGFPNFFMLYGPNTNLGHNSIVYMLESQIAHVMRCLGALRGTGQSRIEVGRDAYSRFNASIQQRLASSVWSGCKSWYVDASGHNSTNWPGFTWTYRLRVKHGSLQPYTLSRPVTGVSGAREFAQPPSRIQAASAALVKGLLRGAFKPLVGPALPAPLQRALVRTLSAGMPAVGAPRTQLPRTPDHPPIERIVAGGEASTGAILYLHGGAFCLGSPATHRSITTRLARLSGMPVYVPDYRLAPEHPYPAGLDDVVAAYRTLLRDGYAPDRIVVAGDSAGGMLTLALALRLAETGDPAPAGLMLLSPVTDPALGGESIARQRAADPMLQLGWLRQALGWYRCPPGPNEHAPLARDLTGLPPTLIQVGTEEILFSDSTRLAARARAAGVDCTLEIQRGAWHVFPLQAFYLAASRRAIERLAGFARRCVQPARLAKAAPAPTPKAEDRREVAYPQ